PDAVFRDPYAQRLAGPEGKRIVDEIPRGKATAWAMITRTAVFDEIILDVVRGRNADLVLNLAAGLDARPWRLPFPPALRWVDVDLPPMLEYKTSVMQDVEPRAGTRPFPRTSWPRRCARGGAPSSDVR